MSWIASRLRGFDAYRKVQTDLTEGTPYGGIISLVCVISIIALFASELRHYMEIDVRTEMFVDISRDETLMIHLNMTFPALACGVAALDKQDAMGGHAMIEQTHEGGDHLAEEPDAGEKGGAAPKNSLEEGVVKWRIAADGRVIGVEAPEGEPGHVLAVRQVEAGEGCRIEGSLEVPKVPGAFKVSAYPRQPGVNPYTLNLTHEIHHLAFGDKTETMDFETSGIPKAVLPLDGKTELLDQAMISEYYIKVVPTTFISLDGTEAHSFQFTASHNSYSSNQYMAAAWFKYDVGPITVQLSEYRDPLSHFVVSLCAIVGGVFTVLGLVDAVVHQTYINVLRKVQMGKAN